MVLYPAVSLVSINPEGSHYHTARDARALAQGRLSELLALEIASTGRAAASRDGAARADPADEYREPTLGHCVKKTRERHAVRKMKEAPSEPSCRGRLQTAISCFGQKPRWGTLWSKGVTLITSSMDERDERKRISGEASEMGSDDIKTGASS